MAVEFCLNSVKLFIKHTTSEVRKTDFTCGFLLCNKEIVFNFLTIDYKGKQEVISSPERMKQLMEEAVKEELAQIKAGNISQKQYRFIETPVQKLKKAIYKAYLKESNEFKNSIYTS